MEPEWRASAYDWDERTFHAIRAGTEPLLALHPPSPCRPVHSSAQARWAGCLSRSTVSAAAGCVVAAAAAS